MSTKIIFNGKEYDSADALPPAMRKLYDDLLAAAQEGKTDQKVSIVERTETVVAGDRTYNSRDALPAELREFVERARAAAAKGEPMPRMDGVKLDSPQTPDTPPPVSGDDLPRWQSAGSLKWLVAAATVAAVIWVWLHWAPGS